MKRYVLTIKESDIGKAMCKSPMGERVFTASFMGLIQAQDVGKRVYQVAYGVYQVESTEQREARAGKVS